MQKRFSVYAEWHYGGLQGDANKWNVTGLDELGELLNELTTCYDTPEDLVSIEVKVIENGTTPKG